LTERSLKKMKRFQHHRTLLKSFFRKKVSPKIHLGPPLSQRFCIIVLIFSSMNELAQYGKFAV